MGDWAKTLFGVTEFEDVGIVVAGTNNQEFEKKVLNLFDEVLSSKDSVYHAHLVSKKGKKYPIVFNVYGAPAMVDVLAEMHDGGCRTIIFVGYAYGGFRNLDVGSVCILEKSYHFDGIYHPIDPKRKVSFPDDDLNSKLKQILKENKISFEEGPNVSVPAVTFQMKHANKEYQKIQPVSLEMETASCFARSKDLGIRAVAAVVISDNKTSRIGGTAKKKLLVNSKLGLLSTIISNIEKFKLDHLPEAKNFSVNDYLASIIADPEDVTNVYKK